MKKQGLLQRVSTLRKTQSEMFETIKVSDEILEDNSTPGERETAKEVEIIEHSLKLIPKIDLS